LKIWAAGSGTRDDASELRFSKILIGAKNAASRCGMWMSMERLCGGFGDCHMEELGVKLH
jgi:hypothetical protein